VARDGRPAGLRRRGAGHRPGARGLPGGRFRRAGELFARDLVSQPEEALGLAKLVIDAAANSDRTSARHVDRIANTVLVNSAEHRAKLDAFAQRKR